MSAQRARLRRKVHPKVSELDQISMPPKSSSEAAEPQVFEEVFDDSDFYQMLLKELAEVGAQDSADPVEMTRQFFEDS